MLGLFAFAVTNARAEFPAQREHWSVTVSRNGENILTIESNHLSGRDLSDEDKDTIRNCAKHLLAFVGKPRAADRELCQTCGGNGTVHIPGGISVCPHCDGDCYEYP